MRASQSRSKLKEQLRLTCLSAGVQQPNDDARLQRRLLLEISSGAALHARLSGGSRTFKSNRKSLSSSFDALCSS